MWQPKNDMNIYKIQIATVSAVWAKKYLSCSRCSCINYNLPMKCNGWPVQRGDDINKQKKNAPQFELAWDNAQSISNFLASAICSLCWPNNRYAVRKIAAPWIWAKSTLTTRYKNRKVIIRIFGQCKRAGFFSVVLKPTDNKTEEILNNIFHLSCIW